MLGTLEHARAELSAISDGATGRIAMGTLLVVAPVLVPRALAAFKRANPRVTVQVQEGNLATLLPLLRHGELDLIVGRLTSDFDSRGLHFEACYDEPMCVVVRAGHPLAGLKRLKLAGAGGRGLDPAHAGDRVPAPDRRGVSPARRRAAGAPGRVGVDPHQHDAAAADRHARRDAGQRRAALRRSRLARDARRCAAAALGAGRHHHPRRPARLRRRSMTCWERCAPPAARWRAGSETPLAVR